MRKHIVAPFFIGIVIVFMSFNQSFDMQSSMERGKSIYQANCAVCHMAEGEGLTGVFPPLADSDRLSDDERLVNVIHDGMSGKIEVKGVTYNGQMSAMNLTDQQTADVINYIRNSWGNEAKPLVPGDVQKLLKSE